jgi:hypothetical protein
VIDPRSGSAPTPGRSRRPRNDQRRMIQPRCAGTPRRGRRAVPRNDQARAAPAFAWSCRPNRFPIFLRDPSRLHDHESPVGAPSPAGAGAGRSRADALAGCHPARVDPAPVQVAGLGSLPTPWLRGRPSPTWGHARPRRDRHRRVPTPLSGGPAPQQQADHRPVASLLNVTCSYPGPEASRASRKAPTRSVVLQPDPGPTAAQGAPTRVPDGEARASGQTGPPANLRPTNARREPKPRQPHRTCAPQNVNP